VTARFQFLYLWSGNILCDCYNDNKTLSKIIVIYTDLILWLVDPGSTLIHVDAYDPLELQFNSEKIRLNATLQHCTTSRKCHYVANFQHKLHQQYNVHCCVTQYNLNGKSMQIFAKRNKNLPFFYFLQFSSDRKIKKYPIFSLPSTE